MAVALALAHRQRVLEALLHVRDQLLHARFTHAEPPPFFVRTLRYSSVSASTKFMCLSKARERAHQRAAVRDGDPHPYSDSDMYGEPTPELLAMRVQVLVPRAARRRRARAPQRAHRARC